MNHPDTHNDHVERDGYDGRDLVVSNSVSVGPFSLGSGMAADHAQYHVLTVGFVYKAYQCRKHREGVNHASIDDDVENGPQLGLSVVTQRGGVPIDIPDTICQHD